MSREVSIRQCVVGHENALSLVGQATFLETFSGILGGNDIIDHCFAAHAPSTYRQWLQDAKFKTWLATIEPDQAPIGYLVLAPAKLPVPSVSEDDLEIKRIYLLHRFQGAGIGKRLLVEAIESAKTCNAPRLLLGVYAKNFEAIAFYERFGFTKIGSRQFNVGGNAYDDNIMSLDLAIGQ